MNIQKITDPTFKKYGKVLEGYDFAPLIRAMKHMPVTDGVEYVPSVEELETLDIAKELQNRAFGGMPIEIGYCNGHNEKLNGLEYHRDSEVNVAVEDMILLLGSQQDMGSDFTYDTAKVEAFLVPAGAGVEIYATTLHYAPCHVHACGFQSVVVLPKGTNTELSFQPSKIGEDKLLFAKNKWLMVHPEAAEEGAFCGLVGENISVGK